MKRRFPSKSRSASPKKRASMRQGAPKKGVKNRYYLSGQMY